MRQTATFPIEDLEFWKKQLLYWATGHEFATYLDSNEHIGSAWECLAAAGAVEVLEATTGDAFGQLCKFQQEKKDWLFGFLGYDLKNELEALSSQNFDGVGLPDLGFYRPKTVARIKPVRFPKTSQVSYMMEIQTLEHAPEEVFEDIKAATSETDFTHAQISVPEHPKITLQPRIPKLEYLKTVESIRQHIEGGDIYEMNFCQEFYAENTKLHPVTVFERLNAIGKAPFTTFFRWKAHFLLSASPERFLKKEGQKLITQPIKGTRRRGKTAEEDAQIRQELAHSEKDRSENVMIVDLVRNDFSRNCMPGSVIVDELCGIYTFATVHQMISTVSGVLPAEILGLDALRDAFPMGSMTGAPKVMAMELIEQYEHNRRGLYSGAVGYFAPNGDFDFNVVIRSILYNSASGYVSAQVGGAIVYDSVPEQEYEECLVKAEAMMRALS